MDKFYLCKRCGGEVDSSTLVCNKCGRIHEPIEDTQKLRIKCEKCGYHKSREIKEEEGKKIVKYNLCFDCYHSKKTGKYDKSDYSKWSSFEKEKANIINVFYLMPKFYEEFNELSNKLFEQKLNNLYSRYPNER